METFVLPKDDLFPFLSACDGAHRVQIPVPVGSGRYSFAPLAEAGAESVALEYLRTQIPPKKYFFRPEEVLFRFDGQRYEPVDPRPESLVLFGLHPCDLHGLRVVDRFFSRDYPDRTYWALRDRSLLIGLGCMPDDKCFCASTGTQHIDGLYDMFLWDLGDRFFVRVRTEAGHDLLHLARELFRHDTRQDRERYLELLEKRLHAFTLGLEMSDLPQILEVQSECETWRDIGGACFACGACSMVCPTCTCFDILDKPDLSGQGGVRVRRWDSCLFRDFDRVAGDHHFRRRRSERVRNRYYHKEHGYVNTFGMPSCVGCGRCIDACPAGINVVSLFKDVRAHCSPGGES